MLWNYKLVLFIFWSFLTNKPLRAIGLLLDLNFFQSFTCDIKFISFQLYLFIKAYFTVFWYFQGAEKGCNGNKCVNGTVTGHWKLLLLALLFGFTAVDHDYQGRSYKGSKGDKATFQILAKRCVLIATVKITPSEIIIPYVKSREFYSVA